MVRRLRRWVTHALARVHVAEVLQVALALFNIQLDPIMQTLHYTLVHLTHELQQHM